MTLKLGDTKTIDGKIYVVVGAKGKDIHAFDSYVEYLSNTGRDFKLEKKGKQYILWMYTNPNHPHQIAKSLEIAENRRRFFEERERRRLLNI